MPIYVAATAKKCLPVVCIPLHFQQIHNWLNASAAWWIMQLNVDAYVQQQIAN